MKKIKISFIALVSASLMFCSTYRVWIIGALCTANLSVLKVSATIYGNQGPATPQDQINSATQPTSNPAVGLGGVVVGGVLNSVIGSSGKNPKGLQLKDPHVAGGLAWRSTEDTSIGGFAGNEYSADVAFDADVYNGYIAGVLYQHTYRGAYNSQATSERLQSHAFSVYAAKRLFSLVNVGLSYNHVETEHRLTRGVNLNLDRNSNGMTMFAGISDRKERWSWASTPSFTLIHDNYDQQSNLDTGVFSWASSLNYDISKKLTFGAGFSYNNLLIQDTFANSSVRDEDYWTIGPRLRYFPTDRLTVNLEFDSQQDYNDYRAYTLRLGVDYAF